MSIPEDELIQRAQSMDLDALATIYDKYYSAVFRYAYYRIQDQTQAEDIASEVFVRMVERIETYRQRGSPILAWLFTIAHNLVVDSYHSKKKENTSRLDDEYIKSNVQHLSQFVERQQDLDCLEGAMRQLTENQRKFIILRFFEEYDIAEVARILGKNERAIRSLQHRALASLTRALKREGWNEA